MTLIRFTDAQLHELMQAARMVPPDLRDIFLERVAVESRGLQRCARDRVGRRANGGGVRGGIMRELGTLVQTLAADL